MRLQLYSVLLCSINGSLQLQETGIVVSHAVNEPIRVKITSAIPASGAEFDPRGYLGSGEPVTCTVFRASHPAHAYPADAKIVEPDTYQCDAWVTVTGPVVSCQLAHVLGKGAMLEWTIEDAPKPSPE